VLSRSSPKTAEIFRPRSAREEQPSLSSGPKESTARDLENVHFVQCLVLLAVLRTAAALATDPASMVEALTYRSPLMDTRLWCPTRATCLLSRAPVWGHQAVCRLIEQDHGALWQPENLLQPPRDTSVLSRLRTVTLLPRLASRTKKTLLIRCIRIKPLPKKYPTNPKFIPPYIVILPFALYILVLICYSTAILFRIYLFDCCWSQVWNKHHLSLSLSAMHQSNYIIINTAHGLKSTGS